MRLPLVIVATGLMVLVAFAHTGVAAESAQATPAPPEVPTEKAMESMVHLLLEDIVADDHPGYLMALDASMRAATTRPIFEQIVAARAPRLRRGYEVSHLGELKRKDGLLLSVWKITCVDKGEDSLVEMYLKGKSVDGFWIR